MATRAPAPWSRVPVLLGGLLLPLPTAGASPGAPWPGSADATPVPQGPAQPRLSITSDSNCPSGPAVAQALAALCPSAEWPNGSVRVQITGDMLVVDLVSDMSTQRRLRVTLDCGARATTVALVIATWTGDLPSEAAGAPVLRRRPVGAPSDVPLPSPSRPAVAASAGERELGAGLLLSLSGGIVPGVSVDFVQTRAPSGLGWQAGLTLPTQREVSAVGGTTSWTRATASVALNTRTTLHRLAISMGAGLVGAYTFTSGRGYSIDQGQESFTGGLVADARVAFPWRHMHIWTDLRGYKWLFPQAVAVDSTAGDRVATIQLPTWDLQWAVGLAYLFR
jgi:hypothetical protein